MDLKSTHPFWLIKNGLIRTFPALMQDIDCDVAVVGAGVTGALVAERLARSGRHVIVLDRREAALGSTSASTSLLQYEIDVMLTDLCEIIGKEDAEQAYRLSYASIYQIAELVESLPNRAEFQFRKSLYVASNERHMKKLREELAARKACGFDVHMLERDQLTSDFGLNYPGAILSNHAATVDAYQLTHSLLSRLQSLGGHVYDRTTVQGFNESSGPRKMRLKTDRGAVVHCDVAIIATGYESQSMLREKIVDLKSTYAVVTQPLDDLSPWSEEWIMWETARPYLYLRATSDRRLLAGGEDDNFRDPARRDRNLKSKSEKLLRRLESLFPGKPLEIEYRWAGTFGETHDGLAYIGATPEYPGCLFALGFGGNGITFSTIAANLIADAVDGRPAPEMRLFRFGR